MKKIFLLKIIVLLVVLLHACNKEKRYSNKLLKGEQWAVSSIKIDGQESAVAGKWHISGDDIYDSVPSVHWEGNGTLGSSIFQWQFQEKGKKFQLNYYQTCEECDGVLMDSLDYFTYAITGNYDVERHKKDEMIFVSTETIGFAGKKVEIKIEQ